MTQELLEKKNTGVTDEGIRVFFRALDHCPRLSPEQTLELAKACANGDEEAIRTMVNCNLGLVVAEAKQYSRKYKHIPFLEWVQEGTIGLLEAAKRYVPEKGAFSTYATDCIHERMKLCLEDAGVIRIPRNIVEEAQRIKKTREAILRQTGQEPEIAELAQRCNLSEAVVLKRLKSLPDVCSLNAAAGENEDTLVSLLEDDRTPSPYEETVRRELKELMEELLSSLDERQRYILRLRFGMEDGVCYSLQQVAEKLGISKERTRQIERQALTKLQKNGASQGLEDFLG